jgi:ABC-2 type transport system ATP-binding protein
VHLLELDPVEKRYGELRALKGLSLKLEPGRIGLLGPNGAGKSTFLKTLLGLLQPSHGSVRVLGMDPTREELKLRALVGYMPEGDAVFPEMNALHYTVLAGELCGLPRAEATGRAHQILHYVGLGEARYRPLGSFSTGMKQRARLAQALVSDPKLLLLDEPTSGLDPRGRDEMLALILDIPKRTGASVILSTHILPDVEKTCDQVVVMAQGEVLYSGELAELLRTDHSVYEVRVKGDPAPVRQALEMGRCVVQRDGAALRVRLPEGEGTDVILRAAAETGQPVRHMAPFKMTLERAFLDTLEARENQGPDPSADAAE